MKQTTRPQAVTERLKESRAGRMATVDEKARPHLIPICYVFDGSLFYTAIDAKPKSVEGKRLARVRNIQSNPQVSLLVDEYDEDWERLWYILVRGTASVLDNGAEKQKSIRLLRQKYPNYRVGFLPDHALIIRIQPQHITWWGNL